MTEKLENVPSRKNGAAVCKYVFPCDFFVATCKTFFVGSFLWVLLGQVRCLHLITSWYFGLWPRSMLGHSWITKQLSNSGTVENTQNNCDWWCKLKQYICLLHYIMVLNEAGCSFSPECREEREQHLYVLVPKNLMANKKIASSCPWTAPLHSLSEIKPWLKPYWRKQDLGHNIIFQQYFLMSLYCHCMYKW